jgi:PIN domain nuclease of toxin-antitoxin system
MRLLLDTHAVLWWTDESNRLSKPVREAIVQADEVLVSAASAWEAAIKVAAGRLTSPGRLSDAVAASGFKELPVTFRHAEAAASLPPHHRDPFDRMLVAQAIVEGLTLVTHDRLLAAYGMPVLWA